MRTPMILSFVLFATLPAAAQQGPAQQPSAQPPTTKQSHTSTGPMQFRFPPDTMACPVGLRVDRNANVIQREVDGKTIPTGQGATLHFMNSGERRVVEADITIHGHSDRVIAQPLKQPLVVNRNNDLTETFHLSGSASDPLIEKKLWTAKIAGITWVELTRVVFSDGTSWNSSVPGECRIEPSLFVLVK